MKKEIQVTVGLSPQENNPGIYDVKIYTPKGQTPLSKKESAHILISGVGLIIKTNESNKEQGELLNEVIEHLHLEFSSPKSFNEPYSNLETLK